MKKKPSRRKTARRTTKSHQNRAAFAGLFVLGFLILSLIGLSELRQSYKLDYVDQYSDVTEKFSADEVRAQIESALIKNGIKLRSFKVRPEGNRIVFEVHSDFPDDRWIRELEGRLQKISDDIRVNDSPEKKLVAINRGALVPFYLQFFPPVKYFPVPEKRPRVAIIMDDLGRDMETARALVKLSYPVTFSILPNVSKAFPTASFAHEKGREVLVHIPMEPRRYPDADPGENALLVKQSDAEINRRFTGFLCQVPFAVGGNNHMGSRFTEQGREMEIVLKRMKKEGLFFVDSLTTAKSIGYLTARKIKVPVTVRDVFLDNVKDVDKISNQIVHLADLAEKKGHAVGICHPYAQTVEALQRAGTLFRERDIEVVFVSQLLEK